MQHADHSQPVVLTDAQQFVNQLLGHRLVVERSHELHDAVDNDHLRTVVADEQPHVVQQQVEVAAPQGIHLQVVIHVLSSETLVWAKLQIISQISNDFRKIFVILCS